jgi:hypothetical protein
MKHATLIALLFAICHSANAEQKPNISKRLTAEIIKIIKDGRSSP